MSGSVRGTTLRVVMQACEHSVQGVSGHFGSPRTDSEWVQFSAHGRVMIRSVAEEEEEDGEQDAMKSCVPDDMYAVLSG